MPRKECLQTLTHSPCREDRRRAKGRSSGLGRFDRRPSRISSPSRGSGPRHFCGMPGRMTQWPTRWGGPLQRRVRGGFSPPSLFIRQLLTGHLSQANKVSGQPVIARRIAVIPFCLYLPLSPGYISFAFISEGFCLMRFMPLISVATAYRKR